MADIADVTLERVTVCTCVQGYKELTDTVLDLSAYVTLEMSEALLATMSPVDFLRAPWTAPFQIASPVQLKAHYSSPAALTRFRASPQISSRITNTVAWGLRTAHLWVTLRHGIEAHCSRCFAEDLAKRMAEDAQRHDSFLFVRCIGLYILHVSCTYASPLAWNWPMPLDSTHGQLLMRGGSYKNRFEWASADSEGTSISLDIDTKEEPPLWAAPVEGVQPLLTPAHWQKCETSVHIFDAC
jgi:hypothetical protein